MNTLEKKVGFKTEANLEIGKVLAINVVKENDTKRVLETVITGGDNINSEAEVKRWQHIIDMNQSGSFFTV